MSGPKLAVPGLNFNCEDGVLHDLGRSYFNPERLRRFNPNMVSKPSGVLDHKPFEPLGLTVRSESPAPSCRQTVSSPRRSATSAPWPEKVIQELSVVVLAVTLTAAAGGVVVAAVAVIGSGIV